MQCIAERKGSAYRMFTTSDIITYVVAYNASMAKALREESLVNALGYRMISYLSDHPAGARPTQLAQVLNVNPALVTQVSKKLAGQGLVKRRIATGSSSSLTITEHGLDVSRLADTVLTQAHEEYFSPLPDRLKATIDVGSTLTNKAMEEGNRLRDGHFFAAYEVFHAFLTVERLLTSTTRKFGLSLSEFRILFRMVSADSKLFPGTLSDELLLAPSTVTFALDRLETAELVTRLASKHDKRNRALLLTSAGSEVAQRSSEQVERLMTSDIRTSSRTEQEIYKDAAAFIVSTLRKRRH